MLMNTNYTNINKKFLSLIIIVFGAAIAAGIVFDAKTFAQEDDSNISYPVAELGNCKDKQDCKKYCDRPENGETCVAFAEKNNLMDAEEAQTARKFLQIGKGPGGCLTPDACESYCDNITNISECVVFAEKNNLMPPAELDEARKIKSALERGVKPPACGSKKKCDSYCNSADHMEECMTFALEAGLMSEEEKGEAQKVLVAIKKGAKPPACNGKEECDAYCSDESHFEECVTFAEAAGFMTEDELKMARKTKGKGPGGCRGKECESFCNNPANQETCFNFALENDLIPPEEKARMEQGRQDMARSFSQAPPEILQCIKEKIGEEKFEKAKAGSVMPSRELGDAMGACFEKFGPMMGPGGPGGPGTGGPGPGGFGGPGGPGMGSGGNFGPNGEFQIPAGLPCTTAVECVFYCQSNPDKCAGFVPGAMPSDFNTQNFGPGAMSPFNGGPGGFPQGQMMPPLEGQMPPQNFTPGQNMPYPNQMPPFEGGQGGQYPMPFNGTQGVPSQDGQSFPMPYPAEGGQMPYGGTGGMMPPDAQNFQPMTAPTAPMEPAQMIPQAEPAPAPEPTPEPQSLRLPKLMMAYVFGALAKLLGF